MIKNIFLQLVIIFIMLFTITSFADTDETKPYSDIFLVPPAPAADNEEDLSEPLDNKVLPESVNGFYFEEGANYPSFYSFSGTRYGARNARSLMLNEKLCELGYLDIEKAGDLFDSNTVYALARFQNANGILASGFVDEETEMMLHDTNAVKAGDIQPEDNADDIPGLMDVDYKDVSYGQYGDEVRALQVRLTELDYLEPYEITGVFDDRTDYALVKFQSRNGLPTKGIMDEETYNLLHSDECVRYLD